MRVRLFVALGALAAGLGVGACDSMWTHRNVAPGYDRGSLEFMEFLPNGHLFTVQRPIKLDIERPPSLAGPATAFVIEPMTGWKLRRFEVAGAHFALSAGAQLLAGALFEERQVKLWDLSGTLKHTFDLPRSPWSVAFSPDGRQVAADSAGGPLFVWDTRTGERLALLSAPCLPPQAQLQWSGDGRRLIANSKCAFDLASGTVIDTGIAGWRASVDRDGRRIATATNDGAWVLTGNRRQALAGAAKPVAISPDGALVAGPLDLAGPPKVGALGIWDASTGALRARLDASCLPVEDVLFSPDSRTVAAVFPNDELRLYDAVQGRPIRTWNEPDCTNLRWGTRDPRLAFSHDGRVLAIGEINGWFRVHNLSGLLDSAPWKPPAGAPPSAPRIVPPPPRPARFGDRIEVIGGTSESKPLASALSPDGQFVAVTFSDRSLQVWDVENATLRDARHVASPAVLLKWQGQWLFAVGADGGIEVLEPPSGPALRRLRGTTGPVMAMAATPDGRWIATVGTDGLLRLRNGDNNVVVFTEALSRLESAPRPQALEFSPTGEELYTVALARHDADGEVARLSLADPVDPAHKVLLRLPRGSGTATIHAASETVAVARGTTIDITEVRRGSRSRTLTTPAPARSLAFSPDGSLLAMTFDNGRNEPMANKIQLWDVATGSLAGTVARNEGWSCRDSRLTFSADGRRLAEQDGCVYGNVNVFDVARRGVAAQPTKQDKESIP